MGKKGKKKKGGKKKGGKKKGGKKKGRAAKPTMAELAVLIRDKIATEDLGLLESDAGVLQRTCDRLASDNRELRRRLVDEGDDHGDVYDNLKAKVDRNVQYIKTLLQQQDVVEREKEDMEETMGLELVEHVRFTFAPPIHHAPRCFATTRAHLRHSN